MSDIVGNTGSCALNEISCIECGGSKWLECWGKPELECTSAMRPHYHACKCYFEEQERSEQNPGQNA